MDFKNLIKVFCLLVLFNAFVGYPQEVTENIRKQRKIGIEASFLGPTQITSINFNYSITHNINIEVGGGMIGVYGGGKFFFGKKDKSWYWAPYLGAMYAYNHNLVISGEKNTFSMLYAPVGIQYLGKKGFTFAGEVAYVSSLEINTNIWGAIRFGYHF
ncbi:hypothetical protein K6119_13270 [Paracrocinitomix mangrovi]|uniref:hypothetical protein n=1 Tax=Paracrocinitomix mangrovi TaxID=2862509 RepID=UPI001C8D0FD6|nr:hypothetical protein [Paracrocinitomix mangrovi]UKN00701.1 hypothetical protein K6119_13270 [Paracrocinitomix mangrovi]